MSLWSFRKLPKQRKMDEIRQGDIGNTASGVMSMIVQFPKAKARLSLVTVQ